jgi:hypothetical protein
VDVHTLRLEIGSVDTSVEVKAGAAHVATTTSDRSIAINRTQIENTPTAGRNYLSLLSSLPGTAVTTTSDSRGANANAAPQINGGQQGLIMATLDGIGNWLSGTSATGGYAAPSVDAIGEIQVKVGNYSAEYGSRNGGLVNVTVKSGTSNFHGSLYNYWRHEQFNANEWFNNATRQAKPRYRFHNPGGTIGGPVLIPAHHSIVIEPGCSFSFLKTTCHQIAGQLAQAPPAYLSPQVLNTTFGTLLASPGFLAPQTVFGGSPSYPNPSTYNWSAGIQRNLGNGFIVDIAYVANVAHHIFGNAHDFNAVAPLTTWNPSGGLNRKYQDPTNATGGLYNTSLIRDLAGGYPGYNNINVFTSLGESNYNSLQSSLAPR